MGNNSLSSEEIREYVNFIIEFRDDKNIKKIKNDSVDEYIKLMNKTFGYFRFNYPSIFSLILKNENTNYLYLMLDKMKEIQNGGNKEKIEKDIGELLAKDYIYPLLPNK